MNFKRIARGVYKRLPTAMKENFQLKKLNLKFTRALAMSGIANPVTGAMTPEYWGAQDIDSKHSPLLYVEPDRITKQVLDSIIEVLDPSASFVEVGCNAGRNLKYLYDQGFRNLSGIEINRTAVMDVYKNKYPEAYASTKIYVGNAAQEIKKLKSESCDVVFSCAVLIHIPPKDIGIFKDMVRVSKKYISIFADENSPNAWPYDFQSIFESLGCTMVEYKNFFGRDISDHTSLPKDRYDRRKHYFDQEALRIFVKNA